MSRIGPHEGKELALMLNGKKHIAYFAYDMGIPDEFIPYIKQKIFLVRTVFRQTKNGIETSLADYIIYHENAVQDVIRLEHLLHMSRYQFIPDVEREIGVILGYEEEDIAYYLERCRYSLNCNDTAQ